MAGFDDDLNDAAGPRLGERLSRLASLAGALVSVALIAGLAIWGYRLAVRDVTGVPVVRALQGPMRVAPEDPGGQTASYQGLAVNRVAAEGEAAPPPDRLVLAPRPTNLADEDLTVAGLTAPPPEMPEAEAVAADDAVEAEAVDAAVEEALEVPETEILASAAPIGAPARLSPDLRPMPRPARVSRAAAAAAPATLTPAAVTATAAPEEVDPARLKSDARLVQLGAFDDAETARKEWQRLAARFGTYLAGRSRVIQEAQSGGRTFFRLRAAGFADEADARRFCAALLAEQAACIPVPR